MALTLPTPADLKAAFPAFEAVADATVQFWLDRAATYVDRSWTEADFSFAIMLLACHLMVGQGMGADADAAAIANGTAGYKTIRSASLTLERADVVGVGGLSGEFAGSRYGRQFYVLLMRNRGGPRVTSAGPAPCGSFYQDRPVPWG